MVNLGEYGVPRTCAKRFVWILVIVPSSALNGLVPALLLNLLVGYNTRVLKGRERSGMEDVTMSYFIYLTDIAAAMGRVFRISFGVFDQLRIDFRFCGTNKYVQRTSYTYIRICTQPK